ncbi:TRAP transporter small permease [Cytobacillus firmus]|uniref:TRAP transporter small permease n=1 Tax=Cytobacillus firmus TaxID=1399 RepID=UPI001C8D8DB0|nr:TRAP transporter small permease [Cytobacillus firmus]MBX9972510.1 TRAP transporter small permease [Cytobacillus firmus]
MSLFIGKLSAKFDKISRNIVILFFVIAFISTVYQVFSRYVLQSAIAKSILPFVDFGIFNLTWIEELIRYMFVWIVFLGIGIVYKSKGHAQVEILHHYLSEKWKSKLMMLVEVINSALFLFLIFYGSRILKFSIQQISPSLGLNMMFIYGAVLVSSIICFVHSSASILELSTAKRDERVVVQVESQNTNMG